MEEKNFQMLHRRNLAKDDVYVVVKQTAEDREGWRQREKMSKTCSTAED